MINNLEFIIIHSQVQAGSVIQYSPASDIQKVTRSFIQTSKKENFEAELSIEMEAAAAIMSHYDKLCCSVLCHTKWNHPQSVEDMQKIKRLQDAALSVSPWEAQDRAHDSWHSPYLRRGQDTPGRGSRTERSSWLVSPLSRSLLTSVTVSGHWCSAGSCCIVTGGLTTALLPASGHRSGQHAVSAPRHQSPALSAATLHTRLPRVLGSGKCLDPSRGANVLGCQSGSSVELSPS